MSERVGNGNRGRTRMSLREGGVPRDGVIWRTFAWLLLRQSVVRSREPELHLPVTDYRPRQRLSANQLTQLPIGTIYVVHVDSTDNTRRDNSVWQVVRPGMSRMLSHYPSTIEDNDWFERWYITILAVVPESVLVVP